MDASGGSGSNEAAQATSASAIEGQLGTQEAVIPSQTTGHAAFNIEKETEMAAANDDHAGEDEPREAKYDGPCEDITPRILDEATYGYAAIHIHMVTAEWNAYDNNAEANRPLDTEHVQNLAESMKHSLKIADAPDRICITMSKQQIEAALQHTAIIELYGTAMKWYRANFHLPAVHDRLKERRELIAAEITKKVIYEINGR